MFGMGLITAVLYVKVKATKASHTMDTTIKIYSYNIPYGLPPKLTQEVEQQLKITSLGEVSFTARNYEQHIAGEGLCRKKQINIGSWKAQFLIGLIETIECGNWATDCGSFEIEFYRNDSLTSKKHGDLIGAEAFSYGNKPVDITAILRRYIPVRALWGFSYSMSSDYEGKKAIHLFAKKWEKRFQNWQDGVIGFEEELGRECNKLGFQMDSGEEFFKWCPEFFALKGQDLESMISGIKDIDLIGSAVFSYWRGLTHWGPYVLDEDVCNRFKLLFRQIRELTSKKKK